MEYIKTQSGGKFTTDKEHGHETSDVNIRAILAFGAFLVFSAVVIHVLLWGLYHALDNLAEKRNPEPNPMMQKSAAAQPGANTMTAETEKQTVQRLVATFPEPRLQVDDARDMSQMREQQNKLVDEYQWINKDTGTVRIPVSRAMEIIAERGLPSVGPGVTPRPPGQGINAVQPPVVKK